MSGANLTRQGALRTLLLTVPSIDGAVTTSGASRITPIPLDPKSAWPAITMQEIAGKELESMDGPSGLNRTRMQVNHWDHSYIGAYQLRELVKAKMIGYKGAAGSFMIAGCNHAGDREFYDGKIEAHQLISDFMIWWET